MKKRKYQICSNCIMDTSDHQIVFNSEGKCDHCINFLDNLSETWQDSISFKSISELKLIAKKIKEEGKNLQHDCIIGLSGGTDSSYMLHYIVTELDLKPLVFHVDGGWNSKSAVHNIRKLVSKLNLDLQVTVIDWEEMRDLQIAYFKSGLSNVDTPQDQAFISVLYHYASKYNFKYILNGGNISTENVIVPLEWMYYTTDMRLFNDVTNKFLTKPLTSFKTSSAINHKIKLRYLKGIKVIKVLDFIPYIKKDAVKLLEDKYNFESFQNKHSESLFTRFYEGYWLPTRFNFDTRRLTFSSQILTDQMTREDALEKIRVPALSQHEVNELYDFVAKKLRIPLKELQNYQTMKLKSFSDYKNQALLYNIASMLFKIFKGDISNAKR